VERARKLYDDLSQVSDEWLDILNIVKSKKKPGWMRLFSNLQKPHVHLPKNEEHDWRSSPEIITAEKIEERKFIERESGLPQIKDYPESIEGLILSYQDRYPFNFNLYKQMMLEWLPHKDDLRVGENVEASYNEAARLQSFFSLV
jgi:hypothetical protein